MKIEIIYNNGNIPTYFTNELDKKNIEFRLNNITQFELDIQSRPDEIIYYNLCHFGVDAKDSIKCEQYLDHLAVYNRTVINGSTSFSYSINILEQIKLFRRTGLAYPLTIVSSELEELISMSNSLPTPFHILSEKQSTGHKTFNNSIELGDFIKGNLQVFPEGESIFVRQYIKPSEGIKYHLLLVGGKPVYLFSEDIKSNKVTLVNMEDFGKALFEKYSELTSQAKIDFAEVVFTKAANKAVYIDSINTPVKIFDDLEKAADKSAALSLIDYYQELIK